MKEHGITRCQKRDERSPDLSGWITENGWRVQFLVWLNEGEACGPRIQVTGLERAGTTSPRKSPPSPRTERAKRLERVKQEMERLGWK